MKSYTIIPPHVIQAEIEQSHQRSRAYGINPDVVVNKDQVHLTSEGLSERKAKNIIFFDLVNQQMKELYQLFADQGFSIVTADHEGFIIDVIGDLPVVEKLAEINCSPGYRWSERDVGTSSIALCIERAIPVQITNKQSYCKRGFNYTNSAAPIFGVDRQLIGVIALTGKAQLVHPHTLGMIITAAKAIENQLQLTNKSKELQLRNNYLDAIIESIDSGVITVKRDGTVDQINENGKHILKLRVGIERCHIQDITRNDLNWDQIIDSGMQLMDKELFLINPDGDIIQVMANVSPFHGPLGKVRGIIIIFHEIGRIRKLVNKMAGSQARFTFRDILGVSKAIEDAKAISVQASKTKSTVLIMGETGTGKELFAQAIHNQSERRRRPFVAINCGAIPRELLESELFGYAEGAFTGAVKGGRPGKFELANGGTVFLDEIGDMPSDMQAKLLRVLQSKEVSRIGEHTPLSIDVRIIAATHVDLKNGIKQGIFREDLFYRLNVIPISIPPLREREDDVTLLAQQILSRCRQSLGKPKISITKEATAALLKYYWPGNVRELENIIERAVNLSNQDHIGPEHLNLSHATFDFEFQKTGDWTLLEHAEMQVIDMLMKKMGFNVAEVSKALGLSRPTLYKKLKKYKISNG